MSDADTTAAAEYDAGLSVVPLHAVGCDAAKNSTRRAVTCAAVCAAGGILATRAKHATLAKGPVLHEARLQLNKVLCLQDADRTIDSVVEDEDASAELKAALIDELDVRRLELCSEVAEMWDLYDDERDEVGHAPSTCLRPGSPCASRATGPRPR